MLAKEIEGDTPWWKDKPCCFIGRINIVKNDCFTQGNLQIQWNPWQITNFTEIEQKIIEIYMDTKITWIAKTIFREKNGAGITMFPDFRLYYKATVIKTGGTGKQNKTQKNNQTHRSMQQDRKPRNKCTHLWSLNLQQRRQHCTMLKTVLSTNGVRKTRELHIK